MESKLINGNLFNIKKFDVFMSEPSKRFEEMECVDQKTINLIGNRWSLMILKELYLNNKPLRFNQLKKLLKPISSKILSAKLKNLVKFGIIQREIYSGVPIKVEYSLTEKGHELHKSLDSMAQWFQKWLI